MRATRGWRTTSRLVNLVVAMPWTKCRWPTKKRTIIGTVVKIIAFPLYILTLGLISLVINGFLLWLTAWLTHWWGWGLRVEDFWLGVVAALVISLINWIFGIILRPQLKRR